MTKQPAKFKFDTEFRSEGDLISNAARARQKKPYAQEEIDAICARARAEGMKSGEARALEAVAAATDQLAQSLRGIIAESHREIETVRADATALAFAAARKLASAALQSLPAADVEAALREAIHQAIGEPRIVLRASPRVAEILAPRIGDIAHEEGFEGRVVIAADPAFRGADCRIEWRGGGAERSEAAIEAALAAIIERRFCASAPTTPEE